jgi:hypothetical protein
MKTARAQAALAYCGRELQLWRQRPGCVQSWCCRSVPKQHVYTRAVQQHAAWHVRQRSRHAAEQQQALRHAHVSPHSAVDTCCILLVMLRSCCCCFCTCCCWCRAERGSDSNFLAGFVVGGVVFGALGFLLAPQVGPNPFYILLNQQQISTVSSSDTCLWLAHWASCLHHRWAPNHSRLKRQQISTVRTNATCFLWLVVWCLAPWATCSHHRWAPNHF